MNNLLEKSVLVLNANFEPLNVCRMCRALGLVLSGKAGLVLNGRGFIRTTSTAYPAPSIIRLGRMVKRPRPKVKLSKGEIFRRDGYTCQYCGKRPATLTVDHIFPRRLGGAYTWDNLVTACPGCNHRKGSRTLQQAGLRLRSEPVAPPASMLYIFGRHLKHNGEWIPFIKGW